MMVVVEKAMEQIEFIENPTLEDYFESDAVAREFAAELVKL
jgi:1-deoxy-D-xylulose-5-phosphate reductoisomerase